MVTIALYSFFFLSMDEYFAEEASHIREEVATFKKNNPSLRVDQHLVEGAEIEFRSNNNIDDYIYDYAVTVTPWLSLPLMLFFFLIKQRALLCGAVLLFPYVFLYLKYFFAYGPGSEQLILYPVLALALSFVAMRFFSNFRVRS